MQPIDGSCIYLFKRFKHLLLCMCVGSYMTVQFSQRLEEGTTYPGVMGDWELNPGPSQEQQVPLTSQRVISLAWI